MTWSWVFQVLFFQWNSFFILRKFNLISTSRISTTHMLKRISLMSKLLSFPCLFLLQYMRLSEACPPLCYNQPVFFSSSWNLLVLRVLFHPVSFPFSRDLFNVFVKSKAFVFLFQCTVFHNRFFLWPMLALCCFTLFGDRIFFFHLCTVWAAVLPGPLCAHVTPPPLQPDELVPFFTGNSGSRGAGSQDNHNWSSYDTTKSITGIIPPSQGHTFNFKVHE